MGGMSSFLTGFFESAADVQRAKKEKEARADLQRQASTDAWNREVYKTQKQIEENEKDRNLRRDLQAMEIGANANKNRQLLDSMNANLGVSGDITVEEIPDPFTSQDIQTTPTTPPAPKNLKDLSQQIKSRSKSVESLQNEISTLRTHAGAYASVGGQEINALRTQEQLAKKQTELEKLQASEDEKLTKSLSDYDKVIETQSKDSQTKVLQRNPYYPTIEEVGSLDSQESVSARNKYESDKALAKNIITLSSSLDNTRDPESISAPATELVKALNTGKILDDQVTRKEGITSDGRRIVPLSQEEYSRKKAEVDAKIDTNLKLLGLSTYKADILKEAGYGAAPEAAPARPAGIPESARQGKDGNWYVTDPNSPSGYSRVDIQ